MGIICSIFSVLSVCLNRMVKWFSCIYILGGIMLCMGIVVAYGITIGYQTAQQELVRFANKASKVDVSYALPYGPHRRVGRFNLLRRAKTLLNITEITSSTANILDFYDKSPPNTTRGESKEIPVFIEFTKSTLSTVSQDVETTALEEFTEPELSDKVVERARRSKDNISMISNQMFWRPLKTKRKQTEREERRTKQRKK